MIVKMDYVDLLFPISLAGLVVGHFPVDRIPTVLSVDGKTQLESSGRRSLGLGWFMHGLNEHVALQRPAATCPGEIRILSKCSPAFNPPEIIRYLYPLSELTYVCVAYMPTVVKPFLAFLLIPIAVPHVGYRTTTSITYRGQLG